MKKMKLFVLVCTVLLTVILCSCSADDGGDGGNAPSGLLIAKVDGATFKSFEQSSSATVATTGAVKSLIIIATNSDGNAFSMTIFGYEGAGKTYEFTGANVGVTNVASYSETNINLSNPLASNTEMWQAPYDDTLAGSVSISEETDTKVIGTFNFKGKNVLSNGTIKTIVDGSFNLKKETR